MTNDTFRERFLESNDKFQAAILAAITAQQEALFVFNETHTHLQESIAELQRLILEQGVELRALRTRLDA